MTRLETPKMNEPIVPTIDQNKVSILKKVLRRVLTYVPTVIIVVLIALYYIQLSHMGA